nr:hypothetical protein [Tanacetum cinerariifolium]GEZ99242.1 hypothetical protein [Tanacetum cinerariifolium]
MEQFQVNTKFLNSLPPEWSFAVPLFSPRDDLIACLNKAMAFLTVVASLREIRQVDRQGLLNATIVKEKAMLAEAQEAGQMLDEEQLAFLADPRIPATQAQTIIPHNAAFQTEDLDTYDSDCDDLSTAQVVLMANISKYGSEVISENDLKAQLQDKDTIICKLKDTIKYLRKNNKEEIVDHDRCDLVTTNEELENSVAKLLSENERLCKEINHVKQVFKDQFDSIKQTRVLQKEHRKVTVDNATQIPSVTTIAPGMFKLDLEPLSPKLVHNREIHINYLKHTQEQAGILRGVKWSTSASGSKPS